MRKADNSLLSGSGLPPDVIPSTYLLTVDTTDQTYAKWYVGQLSSPEQNITSSAEGGLVWIPAGERGMLVAVGGCVNQTRLYRSNYTLANPEDDTNKFTQEIALYDIANNRWYVQPIETNFGFPKRLTGFCAVAATSGIGDSKHREFPTDVGFTERG
jgi:hypothetical protein